MNVLGQLGKGQDFRGHCDEDEDVERDGEAVLLSECLEKTSEFMQEAEICFSFRADFSSSLDSSLAAKIVLTLGTSSMVYPSICPTRGLAFEWLGSLSDV